MTDSIPEILFGKLIKSKKLADNKKACKKYQACKELSLVLLNLGLFFDDCIETDQLQSVEGF